MKHPGSKRFEPPRWMARLVPVWIILIGLALLGTFILIILSLLGITPA
jgi:hypothetical protein